MKSTCEKKHYVNRSGRLIKRVKGDVILTRERCGVRYVQKSSFNKHVETFHMWL